MSVEPNQGLLDSTTTPATPVVDTVVAPVSSSTDLFADQLTMIKNEDGSTKYDTVPKALDALSHSQNHIRTLESSQANDKTRITELEAQVAKNASVDDVVARLTAQTPSQEPATPLPAGLSESAVQDIVKAALSGAKDGEVKQANVTSVTSKLATKYGEKAREVIEAKVAEMGMTMEGLKSLSASSPNAVLALFGETGTPANPTSGTIQLPQDTPKIGEIPKPTRSMLSGATSKDQAAHMLEIKKAVYERLGITET